MDFTAAIVTSNTVMCVVHFRQQDYIQNNRAQDGTLKPGPSEADSWCGSFSTHNCFIRYIVISTLVHCGFILLVQKELNRVIDYFSLSLSPPSLNLPPSVPLSLSPLLPLSLKALRASYMDYIWQSQIQLIQAESCALVCVVSKYQYSCQY